jgi:RNA polymerase sigma factor (sigma-70 family)
MTPLLLSGSLLRTQSDGRLATLARGGHDRAFEAIVERYRRPLQRYLRRLLSGPLAEDVLQATFVRAWQALCSGTEVHDLRPWLYRIAHNQAVNALRVAGTALADAPGVPAEVASAETEIERREELRETLHGIGALPDRQRAAIVAVAVADRPHADVAAELGLSDGALRQLLLRARTALRTAATAITPYPIVTWLAGSQEVSAARVAEVATGAGGAGVAVKAGAAMLAAGAVVAGAPALRDEHVSTPAKRAPAAAHTERSTSAPAAAVTPTADHSDRRAAKQGGGGGSERHDGGSHRRRSGSGDDGTSSHRSGSSGPGSGGSESDDSHGGGSKGSGSEGSDDSRRSGSGESGSHEQLHEDGGAVSHTGDDSSGPGPGEGEGGGDSPSSGGGSGSYDEPSVTSGSVKPPERDGGGGSDSSGSGHD